MTWHQAKGCGDKKSGRKIDNPTIFITMATVYEIWDKMAFFWNFTGNQICKSQFVTATEGGATLLAIRVKAMIKSVLASVKVQIPS